MTIIKHLRISVRHDDASHVFDSFVNKFKPIRWFAAYENKNGLECEFLNYEKEKEHNKCKIKYHVDEPYETNPHVQAVIVYNIEPTKQQVSTFFKTMPILKNKTEDGKNVAGYYHKDVKKTEGDNIVYCMKDCHIISIFGYSNEDLKIFEERNKEIIVSKTLSSREKIYNKWIEVNGYKFPNSKYELFLFIDEMYVLDWNKSPLAMGHKICNSAYVIMKLNQTYQDKKSLEYNVLMKDLYNIKSNNQEFIELNNEKFYDIEDTVLNKEKQITKLKNELRDQQNKEQIDIMIEF